MCRVLEVTTANKDISTLKTQDLWTLCQEHITDIKWCKSELQYQAIKQKLIQMQNFQWLMLRVKVAKCNKNSERLQKLQCVTEFNYTTLQLIVK